MCIMYYRACPFLILMSLSSTFSQEMKVIHLKGIVHSSFCSIFQCAIILAVLLSVITMIATKVELTSASVFSLVSSMAILKISVCMSLSLCLFESAEIIVSFNRMQTFLEVNTTLDSERAKKDHSNPEGIPVSNTTQLKIYCKGRKYRPQGLRLESFRKGRPILLDWRSLPRPSSSQMVDLHLSLDNISCNWNDQSGRETLKNISLNVGGGQLVIITGPVGSGKSSLLMAILGELPVVSGKMSSSNNIAYVSQTPWVFSGTVRENIVFGRHFNEEKYHKALQVCNLLEDIGHFAKGDLTRIGERGVSLSGGQRARVSLARAVYSEADVYLLDDPLSAVDAKVGKHLFDKCICGVLASRLCVLTTHQLQYLKMAKHIVVLREGSVVEQGSYGELRGREEFSNFAQPDDEASTSETNIPTDNEMPSCLPVVGEGSYRDLEEEVEDRMVGAITWRVYWNYLTAALPAPLVILLFLFCAFVQGGS